MNWICENLSELDAISAEILNLCPDKKIAFHAPMGAGKTTLIKSICKLLNVEDVVKSIVPLMKKPPAGQPPYVTFNICNGYPKKLSYFLKLIEKYLSKKSKKILLPPQKGDVYKTHGSNKLIINKTNYKINTSIEEGIKKFINWYKEYYKL